MPYDFEHVTADFADMLDLVGRAFENEVDDAFLQGVRAYVGAPIAGLSADAQKYAERGMHQLDSALAAYDKSDDPKLWRDYLDASYAELFLGVSPQASEPVESCYRHDERVLYAAEFFQVKELMERYGFTVPERFYEPVDHIAMEWRFFSFLLRTGQGDVAKSFKTAHMDTWMNQALSAIIDHDDVGFYTGVANLARAALIELAA